MKLTKEPDLADQWQMSHEQLRLLRRRHGWACVRFSRQDIRYTDDQILRIVHDLTTKWQPRDQAKDTGLTSRSSAKARAG